MSSAVLTMPSNDVYIGFQAKLLREILRIIATTIPKVETVNLQEDTNQVSF